MKDSLFQRVVWIVLDGVGVGELPDAESYGDQHSNTLGNLAHCFKGQMKRPLAIPHLLRLGIGNILPLAEIGAPQAPLAGLKVYGKATERSSGKDTTVGHWEMAGIVTKIPYATFPNGFSHEIVQRWIQENSLAGVLCNATGSGTTVIHDYGLEHIKTKKPILYTSADSVWQVAAHEQHFGLENLYKICESARRICDDLKISRVIARPFIGEAPHFERTYNRKDYAQTPPHETYLDQIQIREFRLLELEKLRVYLLTKE